MGRRVRKFLRSVVHEDDEVCLCFHVTLRKVRGFLARENPPVASLISDCLGAGTGCGWCVPFLKHLHAQHESGRAVDLRVSPEAYARSRLTYRDTGGRDGGTRDPGLIEDHRDGPA